MAPQPGMFPLPEYRPRNNHAPDDAGYPQAGPSKGSEDSRKDRKRKELAGRLGKEMNERRDEQPLSGARLYSETISLLHGAAVQFATRPAGSAAFNLRLYPLSLERSALLAQLAVEERHALDVVETAYEEERARVDAEFKRGREKIRDRLMEGIEERRRRAREEKDGEGTVGDAALDSQSRPHVTRKLRNKLAASPPPSTVPSTQPNQASTISSQPTTSGPLINPLSLSVDELPSPFPLPLTSTAAHGHPGPPGAAASVATGTGGGGNGRKRARGGRNETQAVGGLGKSLAALAQCKEADVEADLGDIRRGNKRRRATAMAMAKGS